MQGAVRCLETLDTEGGYPVPEEQADSTGSIIAHFAESLWAAAADRFLA
jgi:hypothetical protein